jgi:hypothetical protein
MSFVFEVIATKGFGIGCEICPVENLAGAGDRSRNFSFRKLSQQRVRMCTMENFLKVHQLLNQWSHRNFLKKISKLCRTELGLRRKVCTNFTGGRCVESLQKHNFCERTRRKLLQIKVARRNKFKEKNFEKLFWYRKEVLSVGKF